MRLFQTYSYLFLLLTLACSSPDTIVIQKDIRGKIEVVKDTIVAGQELENIIAKLSGDFDNEVLHLLIDKKWNTKILEVTAKSDVVEFDVSQFRFHESGCIELTLIHENKVLDKKQIVISASEAVGLIESYLGPKTILIGGQEKTMLTNVVKDKYGNPVVESTDVSYQVQFPNADVNIKSVRTNKLISFIQMNSKKEVGKVILGVSSLEASAREQELRIISDEPSYIVLQVEEWFPYADNRQTIWLKSKAINDRFGKVVADGTVIQINIEDDFGRKSRYQSSTIGGILSTHIQNPNYATELKISASYNGYKVSNDLSLKFESIVQDFDFSYDSSTNELFIGPAKGRLGQLLNDGTFAAVEINAARGSLMYSEELRDGYCRVKLDRVEFSDSTRVMVNINGLKKHKSLRLK